MAVERRAQVWAKTDRDLTAIVWVELPGKDIYHMARYDQQGVLKTLCTGTRHIGDLDQAVVGERSTGRRMCGGCYQHGFTLAKRGLFVMPLRTAWEREQWNTVEIERPGQGLRY